MSANATKNLLLVTAGFPYGESERSFLSTEFSHLCAQFRVSVLALCHDAQLLYPIEQTVLHEAYAFPSLRSAKTLSLLPALAQKMFRTELRKLSFSEAMGATAYYLNALHILPVLRQRVIERDIHIIYTYWCSEATLAALMLRREFPSLQVVTRFHGVDLYNERRHDGRQPFRSAIADGADKLIFPCNKARDYFLQHWGTQYEKKCVTAYLGCRPFPRIAANQNDRVVLISCSNLIALKRVERIIDALALLPKELSVAWHHIGDGAERTMLEAHAQIALAGKDHVTWQFHGDIPNHVLPELYERLAPQLFLTATSTEGGVPVSIQEASSAGIPAVGTDVGGIGEIVLHGQTGYLLPADASAQEIADAITAFCALPLSQKEEMGEAAFRLWQTAFHAQNNAAAMCRLLGSL